MSNRVSYFDNAKFILIFFVVFGHLLYSYIEVDSVVYSFYKIIYTFHMPAFILISGFFAKGFYRKGYVRELTKKLIVPYIIFQLVYSVFYYFLRKDSFQVDIFDPHWSLWFLLSLFCWNVLLFAFTKMRPLFSILLAFAIGLGVGYIDWISNYLSLSRTFVFFPLFLLGYYLKKEHFYFITKPKAKIVSVFTVLIVTIGVIMFPDINETWFLGSKPYTHFTDETIYGFFSRVGVYILNLVMAASFFSFVPKKQQFFTKWGRNTLYVYLLHGFFVQTFRESDINQYLYNTQTIIILTLVSLLLTMLLSSRFIIAAFQPLIELHADKWRNFFQLSRQKMRNESD